MGGIFAMSIAKFLDPIFLTLTLGAVYWLRSWWGVAFVGLVMAASYQALLSDGRGYAFVAACIAMVLQASLAYRICRIPAPSSSKMLHMSHFLSTTALMAAMATALALATLTNAGSSIASRISNTSAKELIPGLVITDEDPRLDRIGREATSAEVRLDREARTTSLPYAVSAVIPDAIELLPSSVAYAFTSGDNIAYQIYKRFRREMASTDDPSFVAEDFIARNKQRIPPHLESQFRLARSEGEATLILEDMHRELRAQEILARRFGRPIEYRRSIF